MSKKGVIWALVAAGIGTVYLLLAFLGPLKDTNLGFGLTQGLASQTVAGGYSMDDVVLFIVFAAVIVVLGIVWNNSRKKKS